jgi:lipopolysaccharide transport system ATP-binding protein
MHADTAISVSRVSKCYTIGAQKDGSLRGTLAGMIGSKSANKQEEFWALNDVSFDIKKGEVIGIIGKNGAGKSTLLKILSQITKPTKGRIEISGRVASLLEVGTGFHPELSGRENIYLNGTILGMTRQEVKDKFDEIVAFSGVEKFIDTPVKYYSSGMYVRLAFAVAAHLEPEILIIDEVLAVGDAEFQKKCLGKMKEVSNEGRTVIFVSHNMAAVRALCDKGMVLENGKVAFIGSQDEAANFYFKDKTIHSRFLHLGELYEAPGSNTLRLLKVEVLPRNGNILSLFSGVDFSIEFYCAKEKSNLDLTLELSTNEDMIVFHKGVFLTVENDSKIGIYQVKISLPEQFLNIGTYKVTLIFGENQRLLLGRFEEFISFEITPEVVGTNSSPLPGVVFPQLESEFTYKDLK